MEELKQWPRGQGAFLEGRGKENTHLIECLLHTWPWGRLS